MAGFVKNIMTLLMILLGSIQATSAQELTVSEPYPIAGQELTVVMSGYEQLQTIVLEVEYRPNSETSFSEVIDPKNAMGRWMFIPRTAGLLLLKARDREADKVVASLNLSVRFARFPLSGLLVMLFAAVVLFGAIIVSLRQALLSGRSDQAFPIQDT